MLKCSFFTTDAVYRIFMTHVASFFFAFKQLIYIYTYIYLYYFISVFLTKVVFYHYMEIVLRLRFVTFMYIDN